MENLGLVLEGGGMRCVFTAGVLDYFMEQGLYVPKVYAVSGGACQGLSYLSGQIGRSKRVNIEYINDKRYLSFTNMVKDGGFFGFNFMFNDLAKNILPFDFDKFNSSNQEIVIGATNCITGEAEYFYKSKCDVDKLFKATIASSSMPLVSKEVIIDSKAFLDGGIVDSIPIRKSIEDGNTRNIIVLTRNIGYKKKKSGMSIKIAKHKYKNFPKLVEAMKKRYINYNNTLKYIDKLEKEGEAFVIRPIYPIKVKRMETDAVVLEALYYEGYNTAKVKFEKLKKWL